MRGFFNAEFNQTAYTFYQIDIMKKIFFAALFFCAGAVSAQSSMGVKGGVNLANVYGNDVEGANILAAFSGGVFEHFNFAGLLAVQPELIYDGEGAKGDGATLSLGYIDIPVMVQLKTPVGFYAEAGPQIGVLVSAKAKADGESDNVSGDFKRTNLSACFGVGFGFIGGLKLGARYNLGLTNIFKTAGEDVDPANPSPSAKTGSFTVGLSFSFRGTRMRK